MGPKKEELDLHRRTVDEALPILEEFLYKSFQSGLLRVWIVHGRGSGILRQEVRRYLAKHPLVKHLAPADSHHGGLGATQVDIA